MHCAQTHAVPQIQLGAKTPSHIGGSHIFGTMPEPSRPVTVNSTKSLEPTTSFNTDSPTTSELCPLLQWGLRSAPSTATAESKCGPAALLYLCNDNNGSSHSLPSIPSSTAWQKSCQSASTNGGPQNFSDVINIDARC